MFLSMAFKALHDVALAYLSRLITSFFTYHEASKLLPSHTWLWLISVISNSSLYVFVNTVPSAPFPLLYCLITSYFSCRSQLRCDLRIMSENCLLPPSLDKLLQASVPIIVYAYPTFTLTLFCGPLFTSLFFPHRLSFMKAEIVFLYISLV